MESKIHDLFDLVDEDLNRRIDFKEFCILCFKFDHNKAKDIENIMNEIEISEAGKVTINQLFLRFKIDDQAFQNEIMRTMESFNLSQLDIFEFLDQFFKTSEFIYSNTSWFKRLLVHTGKIGNSLEEFNEELTPSDIGKIMDKKTCLMV